MTRLEDIRACFEGLIPSTVATCAPDGTPNITYVSQVEFVDAGHVALSFQFFNKTRENILLNPYATVLAVHPETGRNWCLHVHYLRTETAGPLFERMKAKLAGIASHTGMSGVFRLLGSDVYAVERIDEVPGHPAPPAPAPPLLTHLRMACCRIAGCEDLDQLFDASLASICEDFGFPHALLMLCDESGQRLYAVASRGYAESGAGAEIALGDGLIGVAAAQRTPIRIAFSSAEYRYVRTVRAGMEAAGDFEAAHGIPLPGLAEPHSQLAVPLLCGTQLFGVLYLESPEPCSFSHLEEDALSCFAQQLAQAMRELRRQRDEPPAPAAPTAPCALAPQGAPLRVRHYRADDSVFFDQDYLIKGVAGAILWRLLQLHSEQGRCEFSNRELRLDPALRLPELDDNLESRLILLTRRLAAKDAPVTLEKSGRGRFRLAVKRPLHLEQILRA